MNSPSDTAGDKRGTLFLIPTPLGSDSDPREVLPAATLTALARLESFVVENARSARAFLKAAGTERPLQALELRELNEHTPTAALAELMAPLLAGRDVGLLSEAGCPAVADPGANLVAAAHAAGVRVVPLIGPSAPLLALMASGLEGQRFAFVGYLPAQADARAARLRELERRSAEEDETVLWIETPYRNQQVLETALAVLAPSTRLLLAAQLSLPAESVRARHVAEWRREAVQLERAPTVFGLLAAAGLRKGSGREPAARASGGRGKAAIHGRGAALADGRGKGSADARGKPAAGQSKAPTTGPSKALTGPGKASPNERRKEGRGQGKR